LSDAHDPLESLPPRARDLAHRTLAWCDLWWDEAAGLARAPDAAGFAGPGVPAGPLHLVPQSAWYAFGLLLRDAHEGGDRARAVRVLETLLALQYDEPGAVWNGTFARFPESPRPPRDGAVIWADYDPNWRQFIGTCFLQILARFPGALPAGLVAGMEGALRRAVEGEPRDRVHASYANIALMKAYLEVEAGARLGEPGWLRSGEALARAVVERFDAHGAFEEYNSPTYYGIDLFALALWAGSRSPLLAREGPRLARALWRDLARWYHAGLRNLCGPYTRTYGMDLSGYVAQISLWLWRELGTEHAPLPPLDRAAEHGHDFFIGPLIAALGTPLPDDARGAFLAFPGPHAARQRICDQPVREATGWLDERWMAGAERCGADLSWWDQYVAATLHWRHPDGGVCWLALRAPGPIAACADREGLALAWDDAAPREAVATLHLPGDAQPAARAPASGVWQGVWHLPGLALEIAGERLAAETGGSRLRLRSTVRDGVNGIWLRLVPG